ncbi:hypothetical protein ACWCQK_38155 [Streptomyces sp. NPDC002306]
MPRSKAPETPVDAFPGVSYSGAWQGDDADRFQALALAVHQALPPKSVLSIALKPS